MVVILLRRCVFEPLIVSFTWLNFDTKLKIPKYRFDLTLYTNEMNPGRTMKAHMGNFIDTVDEFDNL
jgi:hypothetical protein